MKIDLNFDIKNIENVGELTSERRAKYKEIFEVLIEKGCLDGVRGGRSIIHFDALGNFMQVSLDYTPWRRRKSL